MCYDKLDGAELIFTSCKGPSLSITSNAVCTTFVGESFTLTKLINFSICFIYCLATMSVWSHRAITVPNDSFPSTFRIGKWQIPIKCLIADFMTRICIAWHSCGSIWILVGFLIPSNSRQTKFVQQFPVMFYMMYASWRLKSRSPNIFVVPALTAVQDWAPNCPEHLSVFWLEVSLTRPALLISQVFSL